jgi:hypothetical protein
MLQERTWEATVFEASPEPPSGVPLANLNDRDWERKDRRSVFLPYPAQTSLTFFEIAPLSEDGAGSRAQGTPQTRDPSSQKRPLRGAQGGRKVSWVTWELDAGRCSKESIRSATFFATHWLSTGE